MVQNRETAEYKKKNQYSYKKGEYIGFTEHLNAVLSHGSFVTFCRECVLPKVDTHKTKVAEDPDKDIANENQGISPREIAFIVLLIQVFPYNGNAYRMQEITDTKHSSEW